MGSVFGLVIGYFATLGKAIAGQLGESTAKFLEHFVTTDVGQLAEDAVSYVASSMPNAGSVEKRDAAVAKLKADLAAAGHDLKEFGESTFIWLVETAYQSFQIKAPAVQAPDTTAAKS